MSTSSMRRLFEPTRHRSAVVRRALFVGCATSIVACAAPRPHLDPTSVVAVAPCPALSEPRLQFEASFWLNLHNFLVKEAKRREGRHDDGAGARGNIQADTIGLRALNPAEQRIWDDALQYYARAILTDRISGGDSIVIRVNDRLASAPESSLQTARLDSALTATLTAVAPIYRAVWWPIHERHDQLWIAAARGLVDRYGGCVFPRLQQTFKRPWPSAPIVIYASTYASWFGAYTTTVTGPHVTLSTNAIGNQESYALESILHESAHAAEFLDASQAMMSADAAKQGAALEPQLSHVMLFYTTGEIVSSVIPSHIPYAERFGLWSQTSEMTRLKEALTVAWKPYLAGHSSFEQALDSVVRHARR
jgi:hypothetical protein